jgi:UDP-N-acetyl-2-amino-2-deoxyglucuronate dehydrogenase
MINGGRTFGLAIAGCGIISSFHARAIAGLPNARLRAVSDVARDAAERRAAEFGADAYDDLAEMLRRPDVDVVSVCVPSGLHAEVGVQVAEAGKHVIVEKPIDVSLAAADRLIAACRRCGVKLTVISQHRFDPGIQEVRAALDGGRFGRLLLGDVVVKWYRTQAYYQSAGWRGTWELDGGGALMNQGVHWVDVLQWLMGPVARVVGRCSRVGHDIPVEDVALAMLDFRSGALGMIEVSTAVYPGLPERLEIAGTDGTVVVEMGAVRVREFKDEKGEVGPYGAKVLTGGRAAMDAPPVRADSQIAGHRIQIADFLDAIADDRAPLITGEEARRPLELILAVYQSARTGREVVLPLEPGRTGA